MRCLRSYGALAPVECHEWGYFSLRELETVTVTIGRTQVPAVERDLYWTPQPLANVLNGTTQ